jgi:hypothetical protein
VTRVRLTVLVVALAATLTAACGGDSGGQPSPPVTPETLAQPFSASITVHFVRGGEPATLDVLSYAITADGAFCGSDVMRNPGVTEITFDWPPPGWPTPCLRVGAALEVALRVSEAEGASRDVTRRFVWDGQDMSVDLDLASQ